jgi:hypothetical protein
MTGVLICCFIVALLLIRHNDPLRGFRSQRFHLCLFSITVHPSISENALQQSKVWEAANSRGCGTEEQEQMLAALLSSVVFQFSASANIFVKLDDVRRGFRLQDRL